MKSVILLGIGEGKELCPFDRETWVVGKSLMWKLSKDEKQKAKAPRRVDRIFSMDKTDEMDSFNKASGHYQGYSVEQFSEIMNECGKPFITSYPIPSLKFAERFPLKEVAEKYGVMYFTNTVCYMIALALYEGYEAIYLWGINQMGKIEYINERRGVEFWLGLAAGLGVEVHIEGPSPLLREQKLYGYKKTADELISEFNINS